MAAARRLQAYTGQPFDVTRGLKVPAGLRRRMSASEASERDLEDLVEQLGDRWVEQGLIEVPDEGV